MRRFVAVSEQGLCISVPNGGRHIDVDQFLSTPCAALFLRPFSRYKTNRPLFGSAFCPRRKGASARLASSSRRLEGLLKCSKPWRLSGPQVEGGR